MMKSTLFAAALALAIVPTIASAQAIEEKNLLSGKAKFDPESGYLFVRGPVRQMAMLLRLPDASDVAEYETEWAEAFAKVKQKYPSKLRGWEYRAATARKEGRAYDYEKPIEPTEENFSIGPIEFRNPFYFGPQYVFSKSESGDQYSYLSKMKPGRYVLYGPVTYTGNGMAGFCFCMGTVAFEIKPGVITDAGNFFLVAPGPDPDFPAAGELPSGSEIGLYRPRQSGFGTLTFGLPDTLKAYPSVEADFRAYGKLDNVYGLTITRLPPIPGVLAYERDKIVDLKARSEAPAAAPAAASEAAPSGASTGATGA